MDCDFPFILRMVDEAIVDLGTSTLVDGRSARDKLLDIRSLIMGCIAEEVDVPIS